jgi:hypothetical protein
MPTKATTQQVTAVLPRDLVARLDAYADAHRWSRSAALAALVEDGLAREDEAGRREARRQRGAGQAR